MPNPSAHEVVRTKINPPQRRVGLLRRQRLLDFLHDNVNRKLLLISASPGYGKTSLLLDFIQDTELPTCWYAMDASDGDPWNFISYLVAAIGETFPELTESTLGPLLESAAQEVDLRTLMGSLVNIIQEQIDEYFLILIDDFQFASVDATILDLLKWFLDHQPDNCCLILASRVMPDLQYLQLTARQEIAGLGSEDLAFKPEEIQAYLALNHNLQVPIEEAQQLEQETEGWITGILLGTHTLWKGLIRSITAAKARDEQIFDYIAQEIFDKQPEEIKRFLKATSILSVMTPDFCDSLLGIRNSVDLLERLEGDNLFVMRLSGEGRAYRYHALFQDFLIGQFEPDGLERKVVLHREAGQLRLEEGRWEVALDHFLAAGSQEQAIDLIKDKMEPVYHQGRLVTLKRWLDKLEPASLAVDPLLLIMRGRLHRQEGDFEQALELYQQAGALSSTEGDSEGILRARVHEALVHHYRGAREQSREMALAALDAAGGAEIDPALAAQAYRILGEYHHLAGELERSKREYRRSLSLYEQAGDRYHQALLLQALGTTARRMGNPLEAEEHYSRALAILKSLGNRWRMAELQNSIGVGYYYQGEYEKARRIFLTALEDARDVGHRHTEAVVLTSLGDLYADMDEVHEAHKHFRAGLEGARSTKDAFLEVYGLCALANLYRGDEAWEHARTLLDQAGGLSGEEGSGYLQGLVAFARGMVAHDQGQLPEAATALEDALAKLGQAGAQRELARATLWYAHTCYRQDQLEKAFAQLRTAIELTHEIKHPHLLVVDISRMLEFLERARDGARIKNLDQLLRRVRKFKQVITPVRDGAPVVAVSAPQVEVITLGADEVSVDGETIAHTKWKGPLVKELFFYLLEHEPVRRDVILDVFWPNYSTAKAQSVFHASLYRMRRILPKGLILYDNEKSVYVIDSGIKCWYDARTFRDLLERANREIDPETLLEQVVSLYKGEYLPPVYSSWCLERRMMYQGMFIRALNRLAELKAENKQHQQAADYYRKAVEVEPFQEDLHRGLMQALAEAGRYIEALNHFEDLSVLLKAELDLPPAKETQALIEQIQQRARSFE